MGKRALSQCLLIKAVLTSGLGRVSLQLFIIRSFNSILHDVNARALCLFLGSTGHAVVLFLMPLEESTKDSFSGQLPALAPLLIRGFLAQRCSLSAKCCTHQHCILCLFNGRSLHGCYCWRRRLALGAKGPPLGGILADCLGLQRALLQVEAGYPAT